MKNQHSDIVWHMFSKVRAPKKMLFWLEPWWSKWPLVDVVACQGPVTKLDASLCGSLQLAHTSPWARAKGLTQIYAFRVLNTEWSNPQTNNAPKDMVCRDWNIAFWSWMPRAHQTWINRVWGASFAKPSVHCNIEASPFLQVPMMNNTIGLN